VLHIPPPHTCLMGDFTDIRFDQQMLDGQVTVTSQYKNLLLSHGTSKRPSCLFLSACNCLTGSLFAGIPVEAKLQQPSFSAWCFTLSGALYIHLMAFFSRTTWVSRHQKGQTNLDFNEARDDGVAVASVGPYTTHLHLTSDR